ncbi:hypothetical protein BH24ACI3_BH24ACI3_00420 [soil metagenome]
MCEYRAMKTLSRPFVLLLIFLAAFVVAAGQEGILPAEAATPKMSIGFVVYNSGTFRRGLERAVKILSKTVDHLAENDEGFLITFAGSETLSIRTDLTSDKGELRDGIENIYVEAGSSAMWDAVYRSAEHLIGSVPATASNRRILVVVTDGDDRSNQHSAAAAIKMIKDQKIEVVVIGLADALVNMKAIDRLAKETGGKKFIPLPTDHSDATAEAVLTHLRTLK